VRRSKRSILPALNLRFKASPGKEHRFRRENSPRILLVGSRDINQSGADTASSNFSSAP
jgi:hypothetical protein